MKTKTHATIADLYHVGSKAELIDGEIVMMSPTGGLPGYAAGAILSSLWAYTREHKNGYAVGDNVGFLVDLPHRQSFSPDAAFYVGRISMQFIKGPPLFAVEVRSEGDYGPAAEKEIAEKRADYFAAGTLVVWDVDLLSPQVVRVYRSDRPADPTYYCRGEQAEAEPAVPGWRMSVDDLFPGEEMPQAE
jgi:Uma2 family endonuclease